MNMEEEAGDGIPQMDGREEQRRGQVEEVDMALDEDVHADVDVNREATAAVDDGLEPLGERHKPREPHVSAIQRLSTVSPLPSRPLVAPNYKVLPLDCLACRRSSP